MHYVYFSFEPRSKFRRIQVQYNGTWTATLGTNVGLMKEILLQDGETIVEVRLWKQEAASLALQFTTSPGIVYGPWGDPRTEEAQVYQV